ncbi:MAG: hypothetical protein U5L04_02420 [Trueperaceae bacterium]|nr:hypothetical protein [Trueperaceae bacterium]
MKRGRITIALRAISPLHHGGDTEGNVSLFRTQEVIADDGTKWDVPFISGNSFKHWLRANAGEFALHALGFEPGDLSADETRTIYNGGALTSSGSTAKIQAARELEDAFPPLRLHGYAAGNQMQESQIRVDLLNLVCEENETTLRQTVEQCFPEATGHLREAAAHYLGTFFEAPRDAHQQRRSAQWTEREERQEVQESIAKGKSKGDTHGYHEFDVLEKGSVLIGGVSFPFGVDDQLIAALRSAFAWASEGRHDDGGLIIRLGGKTARGFGKCSCHLHGEIAEGIEPTFEHHDTDAFAIGDEYDDVMQGYVDHLSERRDVVKEAFGEVLS